MKKVFICIVLLSMMGGECFSQSVWRMVKPIFSDADKEALTALDKGYALAEQGKWAEAFPYLKFGADKGNISIAQHEVAICYQEGDGVAQDFAEALKYLHKAATNPKPWGAAFLSLGNCYYMGIGTPKNYEEAFKWYLKGADIPDGVVTREDITAQCMHRIGYAYLVGQGVQQDGNQAVYWLKKAAEYEDDRSIRILAVSYLSGDGVEKNEVEGVKWLKKAVEFGDAYLQYQMGIVYENGIGNTPKDKSKALEWYRKAVENGYTPALDAIRKLER
ncbi:MAG: sel1 repeat family protein [Prevotella sp.]|nr:sel1 repeat family protein [Prevotella sp.]